MRISAMGLLYRFEPVGTGRAFAVLIGHSFKLWAIHIRASQDPIHSDLKLRRSKIIIDC